MSEVRKQLREKLAQTETPEGSQTVREAIKLSHTYPGLSMGELIRLAYWGVSGEPG